MSYWHISSVTVPAPKKHTGINKYGIKWWSHCTYKHISVIAFCFYHILWCLLMGHHCNLLFIERFSNKIQIKSAFAFKPWKVLEKKNSMKINLLISIVHMKLIHSLIFCGQEQCSQLTGINNHPWIKFQSLSHLSSSMNTSSSHPICMEIKDLMDIRCDFIINISNNLMRSITCACHENKKEADVFESVSHWLPTYYRLVKFTILYFFFYTI